MKNKKKEKVIKILKENKELATGRIAHKLSSNHYRASDLLEEMLKEGKIKKRMVGDRTYWSLK